MASKPHIDINSLPYKFNYELAYFGDNVRAYKVAREFERVASVETAANAIEVVFEDGTEFSIPMEIRRGKEYLETETPSLRVYMDTDVANTLRQAAQYARKLYPVSACDF